MNKGSRSGKFPLTVKLGLLYYGYIRSLQPFWTFNYVELYLLTILQCFESFSCDSRIVDEQVVTILLLDKAESSPVVKPFDSTPTSQLDTPPAQNAGQAS